eukprot:CAMPEP_0170521312 /NCGR_PEP_ID=MMETSP0209-20121228/6633_1 /TAXON_ID=665100 ORGANISM="Litonotus pictus, Strain P1" /NCGR_SAMPLE_ID=MMETSP0209 /ASSEMBLY_ACC=CAM_ASM_000301 /LENGTH=124 /DNA_ID=CAMNT_0010808077 /DNA_START=49 /DNA_END=419 /DNA_ORIENTATION=+
MVDESKLKKNLLSIQEFNNEGRIARNNISSSNMEKEAEIMGSSSNNMFNKLQKEPSKEREEAHREERRDPDILQWKESNERGEGRSPHQESDNECEDDRKQNKSDHASQNKIMENPHDSKDEVA